ncbi:MAG: hypothetical protein SH856_02035 [Flavobacteriales bacterium]|nr:hypothetical protein [Flavobacteriales bacterium]
MFTVLNDIHSALRWIIVLLIIIVLFKSLTGMYNKAYNQNDRRFALFAMVGLHLQLIIGLILYFISPAVNAALADTDLMKNATSRFWGVEHIAGMLIGITVITMGYMRAKNRGSDWARHRTIFFHYLIGFILILATIPWPFRANGIGRDWF